MAIDLVDYERKAREAVQAFWGNREKARQKQIESGNIDQGERAGVTAGKNMDGFIALVIDLVRANGLDHAAIHRDRAVVTLPGYFRPTKLWDLLVINEGRLIAALEFKSQVGPSFGNNFNNRTEEAIGTYEKDMAGKGVTITEIDVTPFREATADVYGKLGYADLKKTIDEMLK